MIISKFPKKSFISEFFSFNSRLVYFFTLSSLLLRISSRANEKSSNPAIMNLINQGIRSFSHKVGPKPKSEPKTEQPKAQEDISFLFHHSHAFYSLLSPWFFLFVQWCHTVINERLVLNILHNDLDPCILVSNPMSLMH